MVSAAVAAPVVARFEYREEDLVEAFREMQGRARHVIPAMGVVLLGILAWGERQRAGVLGDLVRDSVFLVLMGAFALAALHVLVWAPRRFARQMMRKLDGPVTFALDEEGVSIADRRWSGRFGWAWFDTVRETRRMFVLQPDAQLAFVLPKHSLADGDLERVRDLVRRRVVRSSPP